MPQIPFITAEMADPNMTWTGLADALIAGHRRKRAILGDLLLVNEPCSLLSRASWIDGMAIGLKSVSVFPKNPDRDPPMPSTQGVMVLFDPDHGAPSAILDGSLVTRWKTAGDSVLGAKLLARPGSKSLLLVGAGTMARVLVGAYREIFPGLEEIRIWNRRGERAEALAADMRAEGHPCEATADLAGAAANADIVTTATMSTEPVLKGAWIGPGTHVDMIGAFRPDMREGDDELVAKARIFVDARETAMHDIGELGIPLKQGLIAESNVVGDFYDLCNGAPGRGGDDEITLFKNGGGAHLDVMTALEIRRVATAG